MDCNHEWNLQPEKYSYSLEPKCKLCGERQINALKIQLRKHGGHAHGCAINKNRYVEGSHGHFSVMLNPHKCDCGWGEIMKELE